MDNLETSSLLNYSRSNIKSKNKATSIFLPLNTKEKKLIHNVSTKYNLHNNYSASVDTKKNSFSYKKSIIQSSLLSNYQNENTDYNNDINININQFNEKDKEDKENNEQNISKKSIYKILVAVRCRPLSEKEKEISPKETIQIIDKKIIKIKDPNGFLNPNNIRAKEQILEFDYAFDSKDTQETIFNSTTKPLIEGIINGFNATVFAYGATGAGKTYTMLGEDGNPGIMSLTFGELFKQIKNYSNREYLIKLCYLEIYNENIRDLLINNSPNLELREDPNKGLIVVGITEIIANSGEHILSILKKGNKKRTTEATNVNQTSSRSHAILQIMVSYKDKNNNNMKFGKLSLIDLAGSERASVTNNKGMRLIEGANINKSLLTLGNCINALCEANLKGTKPHIPYRDSKLTRLLKDSLGGNSRTVMIANISPYIYSYDDTYNTLNYADRAKHIKTRVRANVINNNSNVNNYLNVIKHLQSKVLMLQNQLNKKENNNDILPKEKNNEDNYKNNNNFDKRKSISKSLEKNIQRKINHENNINNINYLNKIIDKKNIGDIIEENEKKINRIIEEYVQLSKAEVQIKQKVMGIKYDIFNLNNKIVNNEALFPISLSTSFSQRGKSEKTKLKSLRRILEKNLSLLNDISQKNENIIKKYTENSEESNIEMNDFQKNYLLAINKSNGIQKENIEIKYNYAIMKINLEKKENYIKELQKQIELRDNIINKLIEKFDENKDIKSLMNPRQKFEYLTLDQLQYKYSILDNKNVVLNKNTSFCGTHNFTSEYKKNKYSFRPRNSSFIQKREIVAKRNFNFDDYSNIYMDKILYNESESNINNNIYNSSLNLRINSIHSKRPKRTNHKKSKDKGLLLNISNKKDDKLNLEPISLKHYEISYNSENKNGMFNFNQNFINSSEEDDNNHDNDESNENDVTLQSMLNDIEIMNSNVMSKINIIENNSNIKNKNTNNNSKTKSNNNSNLITNKKNKTSKKKISNTNIKTFKKNKHNQNKNNNKSNNIKNIENKTYTNENDYKHNLITKSKNKVEKTTRNNQIYVNRNINNKNIPKKNSFAPTAYESSNNNKNSSLKKVNTNYQKDFIYSSTHNLNTHQNLKNKTTKINRNSSMTNRNIIYNNKNCITNNIATKNYNTNTNENVQNKNLNRSLIISEDKKISLDLLIDEAKKKYNKNKNDKTMNNENIATDYNVNENNKNKLKQFYVDHLIKKTNNINKRNSFNNDNNNDSKNYKNNNNDLLEIYKSYDYPEKNINVINNQKFFNFNLNSKEKSKNYDKFNIKQLTQNDVRKKNNKK